MNERVGRDNGRAYIWFRAGEKIASAIEALEFIYAYLLATFLR